MKFSLAIAATALLAGSAVAAPHKNSRLARRLARRAAQRKTNPLIPAAAPESHGEPVPDSTVQTEYSQNWAGAVYDAPPSGATFTAVSATFTVPHAQATAGSSTGSASAWVGIDGDTCGSAILQTGVDFGVENGEPTFDAWYEWYPDYAYDFDTFDFSAGDVIVAAVSSTSNKKGVAELINQSTGQKVTKTLSAPSSSGTLCGTNAEWIVEDYEEGSGLVPLANWGDVVFTGSVAKTSNGQSIDASGATPIDIQQNGKTLTSVSINGESVNVKYTG